MKTTKQILKEAREHEEDGDALSVFSLVRDCCEEIDRLRDILADVADAYRNHGPVDDGQEPGHSFETALNRTWSFGRKTTPK